MRRPPASTRRCAGRARRGALAAVLACSVSFSIAGQAMASAPAERRCANETYFWTGSASIGGPSGPTVDTGVVVPVVLGTTMTVVGVSADGLAPDGTATALDVSVGGTPATPGAPVAGGAVVVGTASTAPLRVAGTTVVVDRCAEVAVEPPVPAGALPTTGVAEHMHLALGVSMVGVGSLLVTTGRRRRTAR